MKFFTLLTTASAVSAAVLRGTPVVHEAASLSERDVPTITNQVSLINAALFTLTYAAGNFTGKDAKQTPALLADFASLYNITSNANSVIAPTPQLGIFDAISVSGPLQAFGSNVNQTILSIVKAKPQFVAAGIGAQIYNAMVKERDISVTFQNTLISHLPSSIQGIANQQAQPIFDALNNGVNTFKDQVNATSSITRPRSRVRRSSIIIEA